LKILQTSNLFGDVMAHIGDTLRELLQNSELREALAEVFRMGVDSTEQFEQISVADHLRHARGIHVLETPFEDLPEKLDEVIQLLVIDRLPQPPPITVEDLASLAVGLLAGLDLREFSKNESVTRAYERFVISAVLEIEQQRQFIDSESYSLGENWDIPEDDSELADEIMEDCIGAERNMFALLPYVDYEKTLWSTPSGFSFVCRLGGAYVHGTEILGEFQGFCSERALYNLNSQLGGLVESIAKSANLCGGSFPKQSFLTHGDGQRIFGACLSACCQIPDIGKASILDRLRNAVLLLSHADSMVAGPISLSLSFAAIEALICEKDEVAVNKQIKRHVSTLCVQDIHERKKREKVLGNLYNVRCEVMHGNSVNASDKASEIVRQIAAGVVRGIVHWIDNQERSGAVASWKEFMDEINAAARKPASVVGVPDLSELIPSKVPS
jgi:hypothetical protein